jgi:hypothetical protein
VNDDSVGATVADGDDVVLPPELLVLFDELPHALATSATPIATATAADRFRETCMCFSCHRRRRALALHAARCSSR